LFVINLEKINKNSKSEKMAAEASSNLNLSNKFCVQNLEEYNELIKSIERTRHAMSFLNFTTNSDYSKSLEQNLVTNWMKIVLYLVTILIALIGNLLILFLICFSRRFKKKSANYFILNLTLCDLAIIFSCMWVQIVLTLSKNWILGEIFCKLNSFMQMVSVVASVLTLALISFDRYLGIIYPLRPGITTRMAQALILSVWLLAIAISIPCFIYRTYTERKWFDFNEKYCDDLGWPGKLIKNEQGCATKIVKPVKRIYYTTVILVLFFLPIFIMSITYSIIIRKLWRNSAIIGDNCSDENQSVIKKRKRVIIILVLLLLVFFICWSPLETMLLFMEYTEEVKNQQLEIRN
jgi:hypothetical protein